MEGKVKGERSISCIYINADYCNILSLILIKWKPLHGGGGVVGMVNMRVNRGDRIMQFSDVMKTDGV